MGTNQSKTAVNQDIYSDNKLSYVSYESPTSHTQAPLLIHHSLFGRKENFRSLGKKFHHLTKRSVIIPDARNHGSSPPCLNPSIKQMSSDLMNLTAQLGVEKTCLLGHAEGGRVSMLTALTRPNLVDRYREACYIVDTIL